jgi:hypothetical protein
MSAGPGEFERHRIDQPENVEIDHAVVERRDQRIGHGVGEAGEKRVRAGGIDDDEVAGILDRLDGRRECGELAGLVVVEPHALAERHAMMARQFQRAADAACPHAAALDVAGETLLARIEVDGGDPPPGLEQRHGDMDGEGGFAGAALLAGDDDHVRRARPRRRLTASLHDRHAPSMKLN